MLGVRVKRAAVLLPGNHVHRVWGFAKVTLCMRIIVLLMVCVICALMAWVFYTTPATVGAENSNADPPIRAVAERKQRIAGESDRTRLANSTEAQRLDRVK